MAFTQEQLAGIDGFLQKVAPPEDIPLAKAILFSGEKSNGDPSAESPKGARGLMQLTPSALEDLQKNGFDVDPQTFQYDSPSESLRAGVAYLQLLKQHYKFTNPLHIAAAYNAGPGRVRAAVKAGTIAGLPDETQQYVKRMASALGLAQQQTSQDDPQSATLSPVQQPPTPTYKYPANKMAKMSDEFDPVDRSRPAPPPISEVMANVTPTVGPRPDSSTLGVVASAVPRAIAGTIDLAGQVMSGGQAPPFASRLVEPYLTPITPGPQEYTDAAAQGATIGAIGGVPGAVTGAVGGVVAHGLAQIVQRFGLPPIIGAIAGSTLVTAGTGGLRALRSIFQAGRAETRAARAALAEIDDAKTAVDDAVAAVTERRAVGAERIASAQDKALRTIRQAEDAQKTLRAGTAAMVAGDVQRARTVEAATVGQATSRAEKLATMRDSILKEVDDSIETFKMQNTSPVDRATMLQRITQDRRDVVHARIGGMYDEWLQAADDAGTRVAPKAILDATKDIGDEIAAIGLPRETAVAQANSINKVLTKAREGLTLSEAQSLRSALGDYAFRATTKRGQARFIAMQEAVDDAIYDSLKSPAMRTEFGKLRIYRRAEGRLFQNQFVKKMIADTDEGRAVARAYVTRVLEGDWTPQKQISIREIMTAAGESGRPVMKDALVRQALQDVKGDFGALDQVLTSSERLGPLAREILAPQELQRLVSLSKTARAAVRDVEEAAARLPGIARASEVTRLETIEASKQAAAQIKSGTTKAMTTIRRQQDDMLLATRRVQAAHLNEARQDLQSAQRRLKTAKAALPAHTASADSTLTALGKAAFNRSGLVRLLIDPRHREALKRAAYTSVKDANGQELLRGLVIAGLVAQPVPEPTPR